MKQEALLVRSLVRILMNLELLNVEEESIYTMTYISKSLPQLGEFAKLSIRLQGLLRAIKQGKCS